MRLPSPSYASVHSDKAFLLWYNRHPPFHIVQRSPTHPIPSAQKTWLPRLLPLPRLHQHGHLLLQQRQPRLDDQLPVHQPPIALALVLQPCLLRPLRLQIPLPFRRQDPLPGELVERLLPVVSEIKRHILERVGGIFGLGDERGDGLAQEALVLRLGVELLGGQLDQVRGGVVAGPGELDQLVALLRGEAQVGGGELDDHLVGGRVRFAQVGGVAEAEGGGGCGGLEGLCEV